MARMISASIDLAKIDKTRIVNGKNGQKYFNITISVNDAPNQYGQDVAITIQQTKEEREAGTPKVFLGNGKTFWKKEPAAAAPQQQPPPQQAQWEPGEETKQPGGDNPNDDLPF